MNIEKDYLLAQIEAITKILTKLLNLKIEVESPKVEIEIEKCATVMGLSIDELASLSGEEIVQRLGNDALLLKFSELLSVFLQWKPNEHATQTQKYIQEYLNTKNIQNTTYYINLNDYEPEK